MVVTRTTTVKSFDVLPGLDITDADWNLLTVVRPVVWNAFPCRIGLGHLVIGGFVSTSRPALAAHALVKVSIGLKPGSGTPDCDVNRRKPLSARVDLANWHYSSVVWVTAGGFLILNTASSAACSVWMAVAPPMGALIRLQTCRSGGVAGAKSPSQRTVVNSAAL